MAGKYYWHGTTDAAAKEILRTGLAPHPSTRLDVADPMTGQPLRERETVDDHIAASVYLTTLETWAEHFAEFRTRYEQAEPGTLVPCDMGGPQLKIAGTSQPSVKAALLRVTVPPSVKLLPDPECHIARRTVDHIPASDISLVKVWEVRP